MRSTRAISARHDEEIRSLAVRAASGGGARRREREGECLVRVNEPASCSHARRVPSRLVTATSAHARWARWDSSQRECVYGSLRADEGAPAEGIEPSSHRLTAGCLTIRLRWNVCSSRARASGRRLCEPLPFEADGRASARADRATSSWRQVVRERGTSSPRVLVGNERGPWFRAQDSNLSSWLQRPVSCR